MSGDACRRHGCVPREFCTGCRITKNENTIAKLEAEVARLTAALAESEEVSRRRWQDRSDALNVRSREGILCSEWLLRTGKAERERDAAEAKLACITEVVTELRSEQERRGKGGQTVGEKRMPVPLSIVREFESILKGTP